MPEHSYLNELRRLVETAETPEQLEVAANLFQREQDRQSSPQFVVQTLADVADFLGVATQTVMNWTSRADPIPGKHGAWNLRDIVRWRETWLTQSDLTQKKRQQDYDLQQIKLESERLDLLEKQGQLLHKDDVELWAAAAIVEFREVVMQLKEMLTASAPPELKDFVRAETDRHCRDALTAAARRLELVQIGEGRG